MSFPRYATDWRNVGIFKRVHSVREMRQRENRSGGARALLEWVKDANDALASASAQRRSHEDEGMGKVGGRMKLCKWTPSSFSFSLCSLTPSVGGLALAESRGRAQEKRPFWFSAVSTAAARGVGGDGTEMDSSQSKTRAAPARK